MTLLAVSIAVERPEQTTEALERAAGAAETGARLVEWRVDRLASVAGGPDAARTLVESSPMPAIATCRGRAEGGGFEGPEHQRAALYESLILADRPPRYVDVELSAWQGNPELRHLLTEALDKCHSDTHTSLILSVHDFERRPPDLLQQVETMTNEAACAVIKVAWNARSLRDNLEAFDLLTARQKPTIALCMGRFGLMSRVLAPKFGGLLVYAADEKGTETAPGQPTVRQLTDQYRFDRIGPTTSVYGVIGWPVEHSLSPAVHNAGFELVGHDGVYLPLPIPTEYEHFKATVGCFIDDSNLDFRGASVTLPHKEALVRFVAERGGKVGLFGKSVGAANTLSVNADGSISCMNTDAAAAAGALLAAMGKSETDPLAGSVAVLGAGGAARAVAAALSQQGAPVTVFGRTRSRAETLADDLCGQPTVQNAEAVVKAADLGDLTERFDVIVNCTPVGMAGGPAPDESPLPADYRLEPDMIVFDIVYTPPRTPLIRAAEAAGATVITGQDMFLCQAAPQFRKWTGKKLPAEVRGLLE